MKAFLDLIISMWDQFLVFWHALTPAVATIIAATIGASAVAFQIGRQARNAIKLIPFPDHHDFRMYGNDVMDFTIFRIAFDVEDRLIEFGAHGVN